VIAASQAGLQVLSWPDLTPQQSSPTAAPNLHGLAFSPDGTKLAVCGGKPAVDGSVEIFAWPALRSEVVLSGHQDSVMAVAWRDASQLLTASLDRDIALWDPATKRPTLRYRGHSQGVYALCVLGDGTTLVSGGQDQSLRVWDLQSGELLRSLNQHTAPIHALAMRPADGGLPMIASAAGDRTLRFWQPTIGRMVRYIRLEAEPLSIAWLNDGSRIAAACIDGAVRLIDADEVKVTRTFAAIDGWAYAIAIHPSDGSLIVGGVDGQLQKIDQVAE
jgi:WD40 repeat protein